jgi:hypothetical protein
MLAPCPSWHSVSAPRAVDRALLHVMRRRLPDGSVKGVGRLQGRALLALFRSALSYRYPETRCVIIMSEDARVGLLLLGLRLSPGVSQRNGRPGLLGTSGGISFAWQLTLPRRTLS